MSIPLTLHMKSSTGSADSCNYLAIFFESWFDRLLIEEIAHHLRIKVFGGAPRNCLDLGRRSRQLRQRKRRRTRARGKTVKVNVEGVREETAFGVGRADGG